MFRALLGDGDIRWYDYLVYPIAVGLALYFGGHYGDSYGVMYIVIGGFALLALLSVYTFFLFSWIGLAAGWLVETRHMRKLTMWDDAEGIIVQIIAAGVIAWVLMKVFERWARRRQAATALIWGDKPNPGERILCGLGVKKQKELYVWFVAVAVGLWFIGEMLIWKVHIPGVSDFLLAVRRSAWDLPALWVVVSFLGAYVLTRVRLTDQEISDAISEFVADRQRRGFSERPAHAEIIARTGRADAPGKAHDWAAARGLYEASG